MQLPLHISTTAAACLLLLSRVLDPIARPGAACFVLASQELPADSGKIGAVTPLKAKARRNVFHAQWVPWSLI